jgi:hypothetical protein
MLLTILSNQGSLPSNKIWLKVAGTWKQTTPFIKVSGVWKQATPKIKVGAVWK